MVSFFASSTIACSITHSPHFSRMIQSKAFLIVALFVEAASAAESKPSGVLASRNDLSTSFLEGFTETCKKMPDCEEMYVHPGALYSVVRCYFALGSLIRVFLVT